MPSFRLFTRTTFIAVLFSTLSGLSFAESETTTTSKAIFVATLKIVYQLSAIGSQLETAEETADGRQQTADGRQQTAEGGEEETAEEEIVSTSPVKL